MDDTTGANTPKAIGFPQECSRPKGRRWRTALSWWMLGFLVVVLVLLCILDLRAIMRDSPVVLLSLEFVTGLLGLLIIGCFFYCRMRKAGGARSINLQTDLSFAFGPSLLAIVWVACFAFVIWQQDLYVRASYRLWIEYGVGNYQNAYSNQMGMDLHLQDQIVGLTEVQLKKRLSGLVDGDSYPVDTYRGGIRIVFGQEDSSKA